jgi:Na+/proline symporter
MKGGMYSVVVTEILQFVLMTISCLAIGYIAFTSVTGEQVAAAVPEGWSNLFFGWNLDLDWSEKIPALSEKLSTDGFQLFGALVMMMIFKGIFASLAGPVPSYDMQRILSTRTPAEAAKMSGLTPLVLYWPRYLMVAGFAVLALVYLKPEIVGMGGNMDFETVLPLAIKRFVPIGLQGLLLAGLLAAFMGTFAAFINSAPAYLVNDLYKKYVNPKASNKKLVRLSYLSSLILVVVGVSFGMFTGSINSLTLWITSSLYGGYAAANVLKWIWWRFNGYGYFYGMLGGLLSSTIIPPLMRIWFPGTIDIYIFPIILIISFASSYFGTLLTKPEDVEVIKKFYKETRPWGFWKPIHKLVIADDPDFEGNNDFKRDMFNVVVGIVWQMSMVVMPVYILIRDSNGVIISLAIFVVTSLILKRNWFDRLKFIK